MALALERRIDTDDQRLAVTDPTPLGDDLLDPILVEIAQGSENARDTAFWIGSLSKRSDELRESALARLIERVSWNPTPAVGSSFPQAFPAPVATRLWTGR